VRSVTLVDGHGSCPERREFPSSPFVESRSRLRAHAHLARAHCIDTRKIMKYQRFAVGFATLIALPLAACRSGETRHEVRSAATPQYRACCGKECGANCPNACCQGNFASKASAFGDTKEASAPVSGVYRSCCGKTCDTTCAMECCKDL
jgi:hypothetical protein